MAILLALGASLVWGLTNFFGGVEARRLPLLTMLLVSQAAGFSVIALVVAIRGVSAPDAETLAIAAGSGIVSAIALGTMFRALTIGKFGVVMPIIASSATIPVLFAIVRGERPSAIQVVGIIAVIAGVSIVARGPGGPSSAGGKGREGVALAVIAVVLIGVVLIGLDRAAEQDAYWAVFVLRLATFSSLLTAALVVAHLPLTNSRRVGMLALVGFLDIAGFILFAVATTKGFLSVVVVLGSLYPVVTMAVARVRLGECLSPTQRVGALGTMVAVVLVIAG